MTLLLFDLDDTLLGNEMNTFVPAYLQALAKRMSQVTDPGVLVKTLLSATKQMVDNQSPDHTLEEIFDAAFYPALGLHRQEVQGIIDAFYAEDFPKLKALTYFKPDAVTVIHQLLDRGEQAAIATNPLFPRTAIMQRLSWAGLPLDQVHFKLVPSYETFHFAKPNSAYFAELIAQLGWPRTPVVMVGNDADSDIIAASRLGLLVYWTTSDGATSWNHPGPVPPHGELTDVLAWLDTSPLDNLPTNYSSPQALLAVLRSTPAAIATLVREKPDKLAIRPAADEWSPGEVLCHLRDVDVEVNLGRIRKVIDENNPFIPGQDTDPWAEARIYRLQDGLKALADFTKARISLLKLLENIEDESWKRPARHAIFGPTKLHELVNIITGHDILHVQQIFKAL